MIVPRSIQASASNSTFFITDTIWGSIANPVEAKPGDMNVPLTVMLQYLGTQVATTVHAWLEFPKGFTDVNGISNASAYTGNIAPNAYFSLVFNVNINTNTRIGNYTMILDIYWGTTQSILQYAYHEADFVQVALEGDVDLVFSVQPVFLNAGQVNTILLNLSNHGSGSAYQVIPSISTSQGVALLNQLPKLSRLNAQATVTMNIDAFIPATLSSYSMPLTVTYKDAYLNSRSLTTSVGFVVQTINSIISVNVTPTTLVAGKVNNLTITVANNGAAPLTGLSITFGFPSSQVTWLQPTMVQEQTLDPGHNLTFTATVYDPPLTITSTSLQITMKYYDSIGVLTQDIRNIGMLSQGFIELKTTDYSTIPQQPSPGQIFSLTATVTNVGTITASAMTAVASLPQGFTTFGFQSLFIGDVPVNTPTTFTLSLLVSNGTKEGTYQIPVSLTYLDNLRKPSLVTFSFPVTIVKGSTNAGSTPSQGSPLILRIVELVLVGSVVFVVGFFLGRRGRRT